MCRKRKKAQNQSQKRRKSNSRLGPRKYGKPVNELLGISSPLIRLTLKRKRYGTRRAHLLILSPVKRSHLRKIRKKSKFNPEDS
jgi:hypothetical protein